MRWSAIKPDVIQIESVFLATYIEGLEKLAMPNHSASS